MDRGAPAIDDPVEFFLARPLLALGNVCRSWTATLYDPWVLLSAFPAGVLARASVLPLVGYHRDVPYNTALSVCRRRGFYFAALMLAYVPVHRVAQWDANDYPYDRFLRLAFCGAMAGGFARLATNPFLKLQATARRHGMDMVDAARYLKAQSYGFAAFFTSEHPIYANGLYASLFFVILEGARREIEYAGWYPQAAVPDHRRSKAVPEELSTGAIVGRAIIHSACAAFAAAVASTVTYGYSARMYTGVMVRQSTMLHGRYAALQKEVPLMAAFFFYFSLMQPLVSPLHDRCGLGS
jgi:hypothetical protein